MYTGCQRLHIHVTRIVVLPTFSSMWVLSVLLHTTTDPFSSGVMKTSSVDMVHWVPTGGRLEALTSGPHGEY